LFYYRLPVVKELIYNVTHGCSRTGVLVSVSVQITAARCPLPKTGLILYRFGQKIRMKGIAGVLRAIGLPSIFFSSRWTEVTRTPPLQIGGCFCFVCVGYGKYS
jgi:hypothetical protein